MTGPISFGYLPLPLDFTAGPITIATLPDLDESVRGVTESPGIDGGWLYAPLQRSRDIFSGTETEKPYTSRVFGLPHTHTISDTRPGSEERVRFLVWVLGFIMGMRLTTTEAGFLDSTPIKPYTLGDMLPSIGELPRTLGYADAFWSANAKEPRVAKALIGSIHSLFLSHNPQALEYEQFIYNYVALEGCHFVWSTVNGKVPKKMGHNQRIANLCAAFQMKVPDWADPSTGDAVDHRNETLHEGLFFGEPLGFQIYGGNSRSTQPHAHRNILLEMQNLTSRFIVALLGVPAPDYVKSPVDTRQRIGLDLP
jgi:hypothetical protein